MFWVFFSEGNVGVVLQDDLKVSNLIKVRLPSCSGVAEEINLSQFVKPLTQNDIMCYEHHISTASF